MKFTDEPNKSRDSMTPEDEFVLWLSKGFKYETIKAQHGAAGIYYNFLKKGDSKDLYKIPGLTTAAVSRLKSRLIDDGVLYEVYKAADIKKRRKIQGQLVPLHPLPLIRWIAGYETFSDLSMLEDKFGSIIDALITSWDDNFKPVFLGTNCFFPVVGKVGWKSYIAYGNIFGWLYAFKPNIHRVIILTPNLKLLKDRVFLKLIEEESKEGIEFNFIAFKSRDIEIYKKENIKIWIIDPEDIRINVNVHTERDCVFINKNGDPVFAFESKKIEEINTYIGAVHIGKAEDHVNHIYNAIKNLKEISTPL